jgi:membrane-associated phospholipid phosphatase
VAEPGPDRGECAVESVLNHNRAVGECDLSWDADKSCFLSEFRGDLESLCTRENALLLVAAGGVSYTFHQSLDDDVAASTARHPNRWGDVQDFFGGVGNPPHQLAAISGLYAYSLLHDDVEAHELSKSLFNAVAISQIGTTALKFAANTTRPNGDPYGWPSGHTSSSFAFAAVLEEYYGPWIGLPAYALAGLVAWERIDDREHDLSDIVFGAALGYVIGRTVANEHEARIGGMQLEPYSDPTTGSSGIALERRF